MMLLMANDAVIPNEVVDAVDREKHRRYPFAG